MARTPPHHRNPLRRAAADDRHAGGLRLAAPGGRDARPQRHALETAPGGVETDIGTASTNVFAAFYFAVPNTLTPAGHWSFRATFDGESTYLPTDATTGVDVGNPPPSLTLSTSAAIILSGGHVTVTATLGAWHSNDQVSIYGTTGGGAPQLVGSGAVNSSGIFAVSLSPTHNPVYSASWAADDTYLPATSGSKAVFVLSRGSAAPRR